MSEDLNPVVPAEEQPVEIKEEAIVEEAAAQTSDQPNAESVPETAPENTRTDFSNMGLKEIVDTFKELIDGENMQQLYKHAEALKAAFYKNLRKEKIASGVEQPAETPAAAPAEGQEADAKPQAEETETVSFNPFAEIERGFKDLYSQYKVKRAAFTQEIEKQKEENYQVKTALIDELKALVEASEDLKETFPKFRDIQARWRAAGPVPQAKMKDLYDTYQHFVEKFYDYVKINKEFRDLDFKKNLEAKERLCAKAEALADEEDAVGAFRTLQKLHEQWKELGPVSKEFRDSIWERFRAATSVINKKHQAYFESQKGSQKENFEAKTALCEKVEEIAKTEVTDSTQWNKLTKEIEAIQKEWKTIGFASKKENQKVYDRFRAACDEFFARKRDYYAGFKSQMQDNLARKIELCEKAEALKDSTDWKKTSDALIELQRQWKEIGAVPRKKSEQLWKRFRAACDAFFNERDKQGKPENDFYGNLKAKRALIEEIEAYVPADAEADAEAARGFAERWSAIGFVPFKEKEAVGAAYKAAMQAKFPEWGRGGRREGGRGPVREPRRNQPLTEKDKLTLKYNQLQQDIQTYENNIGFFGLSKGAEQLKAQMQQRIDAAKEDLKKLEAEIRELVAKEAEENND